MFLLKNIVDIVLIIIVKPLVYSIVYTGGRFDSIVNTYNVVSFFSLRVGRRFLMHFIDSLKIAINSNERINYYGKWKLQFRGVSDEAKMLIIHVFYSLGMITDDFVKDIVMYAQNTSNKDYRYWLTMDISKIIFFEPKAMYREYYKDRKSCLEKIVKEHNFKKEKKQGYNVNDVCIVTYLLDDSIYNSVQRVAMMISEQLCNKYDNIYIVVLDSFYEDEPKAFSTLFSKPLSSEKEERIKSYFGSKVSIQFVSKGSYKQRLQEALDMIYDINPWCIVDISDEYSVISLLYSEDYRVYYIPLRYYVSSLSFYKILIPKDLGSLASDLYPCMEIGKIADWSFPEYTPRTILDFSRADINISDDKFIVATIGNNEKACDNLFVDMMNELLEENPLFVWILVGGNGSSYMHKVCKKHFIEQRIIEWGFEENLLGLCKVFDVVVRPNITGSSGATAIAAQQGVPIVLTNFLSDPLRWLGLDYVAGDSYMDLKNEIQRLYKNRAYYDNRVKITKIKIANATNANMIWDKFLNILSKKD